MPKARAKECRGCGQIFKSRRRDEKWCPDCRAEGEAEPEDLVELFASGPLTALREEDDDNW